MQYLGRTRRVYCLSVASIILLASLLVLASPLGISRAWAQDPLEGLEQVGEQAGLKGETTDLYILIGRIVNIVFSLLGIILVILLIIGGTMWMTSHGSEEQLKRAKTMIKDALIGIIIIVISYALARFVVGALAEAFK